MKALKGDLVLIERQTSSYSLADGHHVRTEYVFGVVASATREGIVKTYRTVGYGDALLSDATQTVGRVYRETCYAMPASEIDVTGVLTAAKEHHWPNHPGQPMPFDSLESAKDCARPFRKDVAA